MWIFNIDVVTNFFNNYLTKTVSEIFCINIYGLFEITCDFHLKKAKMSEEFSSRESFPHILPTYNPNNDCRHFASENEPI